MIAGRRGFLVDLQVLRRRPQGGEHGQGIGLRIEGVERTGLFLPVGGLRAPGAQTRGDQALPVGAGIGILRSDLEQRHIGKAAIGVARRGGGQTR